MQKLHYLTLQYGRADQLDIKENGVLRLALGNEYSSRNRVNDIHTTLACYFTKHWQLYGHSQHTLIGFPAVEFPGL